MYSFRLYRRSVNLMLFCATLVVGQTGNVVLDRINVVAVAFFLILASFTGEDRERFSIPRPFANLLAMVAFSLVVFGSLVSENLRALANEYILLLLIELLITLMIILVFLPNTPEIDWLLLLLALVQVFAGIVISPFESVGPLAVVWSLLAIWVLRLSFLRREAARYLGPDEGPRPADSLELQDLLPSLGALSIILLFAGLFFLVWPRRDGQLSTLPISEPASSPAEADVVPVRIEQLGPMLDPERIVMTIELYDGDDNRVSLAYVKRDLLWRGAVMSLYEEGGWRRQTEFRGDLIELGGENERPDDSAQNSYGIVVQRIRLELTETSVLYGLRPIVGTEAARRRREPEMDSYSGCLRLSYPSSRPVEYLVRSANVTDLPQQGELLDRSAFRFLLKLEGDLRDQLRGIAQPVVAEIKRGSDRATTLERFLRDSGRFHYSGRSGQLGLNVDPVIDLLNGTRTGDSARFASALALLLRSIDIPARIVTGYKGGDWNNLTRVLTVRQRHAHWWVEAEVGSRDDRTRSPLWMTLDPTPVVDRSQSSTLKGRLVDTSRAISDGSRYMIIYYMIDYNRDRQGRLLKPLYVRARAMYHKIASSLHALRESSTPSARTRGSIWRILRKLAGYAICIFAITFTIAIIHMLYKYRKTRSLTLLGWPIGRRPAGGLPPDDLYDRLARILAKRGLERGSGETQREFASRASVFLTSWGTTTLPVALVPVMIVDAFYAVQFGRVKLAPARRKELKHDLDRLQNVFAEEERRTQAENDREKRPFMTWSTVKGLLWRMVPGPNRRSDRS